MSSGFASRTERSEVGCERSLRANQCHRALPAVPSEARSAVSEACERTNVIPLRVPSEAVRRSVRHAGLSAAQARRIALAAQGFADARPTGRVDARHIRRVLSNIAVLQIDSVNVFCRTHYLPVFARLGPYSRDLLDRLTAHTAGPVRRELFEYWAHEASLVPVELQPLLRWRMARARAEAWGGMRRVAQDNPGLLD